jgi:hypothetical protein
LTYVVRWSGCQESDTRLKHQSSGVQKVHPVNFFRDYWRSVGFEWESKTLPGMPTGDLLAALLIDREQDFLRFIDPCCEVC